VAFLTGAFFFFFSGAFIYFMKKKDEPKSAQTACYAALIGMGVSLVLNIALRVMGGV